MIDTLYIEEELRAHPRVLQIRQRFPRAVAIHCNHYGEVFNRKAQNFRLQKRNPALILTSKRQHYVLPAPPGYGIGGRHNYYFSHMLNCVYDCRYCFLQGMYRSAHYVLFANYEDFVPELSQALERHRGEDVYFFSGYDCDSLALEPVTGFAEFWLPFFRQHGNAFVEFRTKSTQVRFFLDQEPLPNVILAFSFTPEEISRVLEHKVPTLQRRLDSMVKLQNMGWRIGLRFDPIMYTLAYRDLYRRLFACLFERLHKADLHSVSYGSFRMPENFYQNSVKLYPEEKLFAGPLERKQGMVSYRSELESEMMTFCHDSLLDYVPAEKLFPCVY